MSATLLDFGDRATGDAIDQARWNDSDRIRRLRPRQLVTGTVVAIYPRAPRVVGIIRPNGEHALIVRRRPV